MKLDKVYKNVSVSTGTLDVNELVDNCFDFLIFFIKNSEVGWIRTSGP